MKKRYRKNGNALRWIDTFHAKKYRAMLPFRIAHLAGISLSAYCQIKTISATPAKTSEERAKKMQAVADVVVGCKKAQAAAWKESEGWWKP